jgi:hypothetical protein
MSARAAGWASASDADDTQVVESGTAKLDILERQKSAVGVVWVRAGKAPIRLNTGGLGSARGTRPFSGSY